MQTRGGGGAGRRGGGMGEGWRWEDQGGVLEGSWAFFQGGAKGLGIWGRSSWSGGMLTVGL